MAPAICSAVPNPPLGIFQPAEKDRRAAARPARVAVARKHRRMKEDIAGLIGKGKIAQFKKVETARRGLLLAAAMGERKVAAPCRALRNRAEIETLAGDQQPAMHQIFAVAVVDLEHDLIRFHRKPGGRA